MRKVNLNITRGLPMYFIKQRINGLDFIINYSDTEPAQVGDEVTIQDYVYRVDKITEQRLSPLEYGVSVPVHFQSTVSKIIARLAMAEMGKRVELPVTRVEEVFPVAKVK